MSLYEILIRLALRRGYEAALEESVYGDDREPGDSPVLLPTPREDALVDELMSKYVPVFRDQFSDHH